MMATRTLGTVAISSARPVLVGPCWHPWPPSALSSQVEDGYHCTRAPKPGQAGTAATLVNVQHS